MMLRKLTLWTITLLCIGSSSAIFAQEIKKINGNFQEVTMTEVNLFGTPQIYASNYKLYKLDVESVKSQMIGVDHADLIKNGFEASVSFPHPDGTFHSYLSKENSTMDSVLAAKFPEIKSYDGYANGDVSVKWDITPHGFHAMIMVPGLSTIYIDPVIKGNTEYYIVYFAKDFITSKVIECGVETDTHIKQKTSPTVKSFGSCEKRTYRLALAATGEYTTYHGGTVALAQAAQVTTMNRVNGVYMREMAIQMNIIGTNNLIIYTNGATDPYTNNNGGTMLNENQTNLTSVIGSANYDIGHVFSTGGGGIAQLYSPCSSSSKAKGVTGSSAPIGDAFDIDYVAHEMGHQFGANHTFNNNNSGSCSGNANASTSYEPGSGSTIMAYAGICTATFNVQNNSDDYFQSVSLQEIGTFITGASHTCPVKTSLANSAPVVNPVTAVTVPQGTPFFLTASATDVDGNSLTYCWEQMNAGTSTTTPTATQTTKANFRTFDPTTSPTRYFPNLTSLAANGPFTWEVLPTVARTMNFRVTARDNAVGGGCNDEENVVVTVSAAAGPFVVTYPTATGITWAGASTQTVTWNVASTTASPINCANVDILLSIDGGATYPTVLATGVPNDGSQVINVPNTPSTTCRVMVKASGGNFFDISNNNFTITAATFDYTMATTPSTISICQGSNAVYTVTVGSIGGFSNAVALTVSGVPAGATSNFSPSSVTPAGTSTLTISNTASVIPGTYTITITGNSTTGTKVNTVTLIVSNGSPSAVTQSSPANGATGVNIPTTFTWTTAPEVGVTYSIDIATDAAFTSIVDQATGLTSATYISSTLSQSTTYYWRVRSETGCGTSAWSSNFSFTTSSCFTYAATTVPVAISATGTPSVTSTITVPAGGTINDVNVLNLVGTHTYMSDLTISLTSPAGTTRTLFAGICTSLDNFNLNFDDGAASATIPCPPTTGLTYQPTQTLAAFNGETAAGIWTLTIADGADQDGGSLTSWSLQLCVTSCTPPSTPGTITGSATPCSASTGNSYSIASVSGATSYTWTVPAGATVTAGQGTTSATVTMGSTSGNITVTSTNACGTSAASTLALTASTAPATPGTITGSATVCSGSSGNTYSITAISGATSYTWTVPTGASITAGQGTISATVTMGSSSGNITVTASNACGTSTASVKAITVSTAPATPGSISGTTTLCSGATGNVYSITAVSGATSYTWTVPAGATITAGQGTVSATVSMGSTSGNITVTATNACGTSSASTLAIIVNSTPSTPGTISGSATACSNSTGNVYSITPVAGATSYTWSVPGGASVTSGQGTSSATISFGAASGNVTVTATNSCGTSSASSLAITLSSAAPATPGTITGSSSVCAGSTGNTYSIAAVSGATSYTWSVPAGSTVTAGQGSTSVIITFGSTSGNVSVTASSTCGTSAASNKAITVNAIPATPSISVTNNCGSSTLSTVSSGTLLWSTGGSTPSVTVSSGGTYTVTTTVSGCTSLAGSATAAPIAIPSAPVVSVSNSCGSSVLSSDATGTVLWSTGESTPSITVISGGTFTLTQTVSGCTSPSGSGIASPYTTAPTPIVSVINSCGYSTLTSDATGSVLWSTGETTTSIMVMVAGSYTVTQNVGGCLSAPGTGTASPTAIPATPTITVLNKCGMTDLSTSASGALMWSTGETTASITVTTAGTYYVSQTVGGCTSAVGTTTASPLAIPTVTFAPLSDVCINSTPFALTGGSPAGGTYSGTGVSTNQFDPSVAGYGTFTLTYTFTDVNGCTDSNQQPITVGCANLEEELASGLSIYPNPTDGKLEIALENDLLESVTIFDQTGRIVQQINFTGDNLIVDISQFASGVYSLVINTKNTSYKERIIKN